MIDGLALGIFTTKSTKKFEKCNKNNNSICNYIRIVNAASSYTARIEIDKLHVMS